MTRIKGENWVKSLREYLTGDPPAVRFELCERTQEGFPAIQQFTIPEGWDDELLWKRVGELVAHAQDDCNGSDTGRRSYVVVAYDAHREAIGRSQQIRFFTAKNATDDGLGSEELEGPNQKGLIAQLMRHTEAMVRTALVAATNNMQSMNSLNAQLLREKTEVEERRINLLVEMEELVSQRHQRAMEERRETAKEERMGQLFGQLQRVMPALVARILPGTGVAADASAQALAGAVKGLVEGLPDEKMQQLMNVIGPERSTGLIEVLGIIQQIENSPSATNPATNSNGAVNAAQ
jgi:hypothetical protein